MIIVDVNILLYAVNTRANKHKAAVQWWEDSLAQITPVGVPWMVVVGFLRLVTHPSIMTRPLSVTDAIATMSSWLEQPPVRTVVPTERHWPILSHLLTDLGTGGNITNDAHLAAMAIEHGATVCSCDSDFIRFKGVRWIDPLA